MVSVELDRGRALSLQQRMVEIRRFEDEIQRLFSKGQVRGTTHLCQGQEAVAVGACDVLEGGDQMVCTYRGHGAMLAMGAPLDATFAEMLGRASGLCRGKGGSMHLTDLSIGALGSFAIVGAGMPVAVGAAWASVTRDTGRVALAFFGDGATNIGAFHEALNLAAVWRLPVVFMCENNLYGEYSPIRATTPMSQLSNRAVSYAMPGMSVDGNDVLAVRDCVGDAVARARSGKGPTLVEALTYRQSGHSRSDPARYRPKEEVDQWLTRDPIAMFASVLKDRWGVSDADLAAMDERAASAVEGARDWALRQPEPALDVLYEDVLA